MYLHNGIKISQTIIINDTVYDITWFDQASPLQLSSLNITHDADPVYPDPTLYTWTENADGSLTITPIPAGTLIQQQESKKANNIEVLWQAAHDYEFASINGSAVGLVTIGIMLNLPKCKAVSTWITSIWNLYYTRKPLITDVFDPAMLDFSSCGPMPYSIPQLMAEVGYN